MIRGLPTTIFAACLAGAVGVGLFFVKHEVKEQEARLAELNNEIESNQEAIHVLKAEWSYLNDPTRLRALSEKHLSMKVLGPSQIASLDALPAGGPAYAAARGGAPAPAALDKAEAPSASVAAKAEAKAPAPKLAAMAPLKAEPKPAAAHPARPAPPAPTRLAAAPKPAQSRLVPGQDTTPHGIAAPVAVTAAPVASKVAAAPAPIRPAATAPAAGRPIVIQSPALASTPALPGEVR
ncbi:MAG: energy transducer TonB [Magnetospirillum sp.]|nr:energy transducer TonB [Magnetospirillum sp.]